MSVANMTMIVAPVVVLPDELVLEILSWLPVKALMRFRCVSKGWNSLIFHPPLVKLHLQRSPKNTKLFLTYSELLQQDEGAARRLLENVSSIFDDCHHFNYNYFYLDSCNGLVCMHRSFTEKEFVEFRFKFWNPATRILSKDSPPLRLHFECYKLISTKLGFGYDDQSDTYKVVILLMDCELLDWEAKVYCLGDTCWTSISPRHPFAVPRQFNGQVRIIRGQPNGRFVCGTLNWLPSRVVSADFEWQTLVDNKLVIFSYDLNKETCKHLLLPDGITKVSNDLGLEVLRGCLCLSHDHHGTCCLVVWLMREFGDEKSWIQLLNVNYEHIQFHDMPYHNTLRVLWLCRNDNVILLANRCNLEFFVYNRRDNTVHRIECTNRKLPCFSQGYVQSLVLPY